MSNIATLVNKPIPSGCVGIEVEVEFEQPRNFPDAPRGWTAKHDGSLRSGREYTLNTPIRRGPTHIKNRLTTLFTVLSAGHDMRPIKNALSASTHIHLSALHLTPTQVATAATIWWLLEPYVMDDCGDERKTNRYTRPFDLNSGVRFFSRMRDSLRGPDTDRYYALNPTALSRFGTLEYRGMRSSLDADQLTKWISLLCRLQYDVALRHVSPLHVLERFFSSRDRPAYIKSMAGGLVETPLAPHHVAAVEERALELYDFACIPGVGKTWADWEAAVFSGPASATTTSINSATVSLTDADLTAAESLFQRTARRSTIESLSSID